MADPAKNRKKPAAKKPSETANVNAEAAESEMGVVDMSKKSWWKILLLCVGCFIFGFLALALVRFLVTSPPAETHYHANFQVYINGQRELFQGPGYYEEVSACTADGSNDPKTRAHMHDNVNNVVHVHDARVTWEDFFTNIGWSIGSDFIRSPSVLYTKSDDKQVVYILNGQHVPRVDNLVIGDQDRLLVSYDSPGTAYMNQYKNIQNNAAKYDAGKDPSTCTGLNGSDTNTPGARLKRAFFGT